MPRKKIAWHSQKKQTKKRYYIPFVRRENHEHRQGEGVVSDDIVNFYCGCFVKYWADGNNLRSALACCSEHEQPRQTLDNLSTTHDLRIEKKYVPHRLLTFEEQLDQLKDKFPSASLQTIDNGRWIRITLPLKGWNKESAFIYFRVPEHYPFAYPDGCNDYFLMLVDNDLRLGSGNPVPRSRHFTYDNMDYIGVGGSLQAWNPMYDTLLTYARVCKIALQKMGEKP